MQSNFFDMGETIPEEKTGHSQTIGCDGCSLQEKCETPKFTFGGRGEKRVLILADYPSDDDDFEHKRFIGEEGQIIRQTLRDLGYNLMKDCWYGYALSCRPSEIDHNTGFPDVKDGMISRCQQHMYGQINQINPRVIIAMGTVATKALIKWRAGGRLSGLKYKSYFGFTIPDQDWKMFICPTFSPEYLVRSKSFNDEIDKVTLKRFKETFKNAFDASSRPFYTHNYHNDVIIYPTPEEAIEFLKIVKKTWKELTFDFETTGIKPHREGHRIVCTGISDGLMGHAFPHFADNPEFMKIWVSIMMDKKIKKIAHNASFEDMWQTVRGGSEVRNFYWCTMVCEHIQWNLRKVGLKFLSYTTLGIMNYDDEVDRFLKPTSEEEEAYGKNAINQIDIIWKKNPLKVLKYVGQDSLFAHKALERQRAKFTTHPRMKKAFKFFHESTLAIGDMEKTGIKFDMAQCDDTLGYLGTKIEKMWKRIMKLPEVEGWNKSFSGKGFEKHLYETLKYDVPKVSSDLKEGKFPCGEEALLLIDTLFTRSIVKLKKQIKIFDTIELYKKETVNGVVRPSYSTINVPTFRTSCRSPNVQNTFKRNEHAKKMLRETIIPSPGNRILASDYSAIEVQVAGCIFPDPNWLKYCRTPGTDMHRDCTMELLQADMDDWLNFGDKGLLKGLRGQGKNKWVFPNIYGSGFNAMAANLHLAFTAVPELEAWLRKKKLWGFESFKRWIKKYYQIYWEKKFPHYKRMREAMHRKYERTGYVDSPVGYRFYGPMSYNDFCNYPVQGTAGAIMLWTLKECMKEANKRKLKSKIILEIHDDITWDLFPPEQKEVIDMMTDIGTQKVKEHWDWINVPLKLESEVSHTDGSWAVMEEV